MLPPGNQHAPNHNGRTDTPTFRYQVAPETYVGLVVRWARLLRQLLRTRSAGQVALPVTELGLPATPSRLRIGKRRALRTLPIKPHLATLKKRLTSAQRNDLR